MVPSDQPNTSTHFGVIDNRLPHLYLWISGLHLHVLTAGRADIKAGAGGWGPEAPRPAPGHDPPGAGLLPPPAGRRRHRAEVPQGQGEQAHQPASVSSSSSM